MLKFSTYCLKIFNQILINLNRLIFKLQININRIPWKIALNFIYDNEISNVYNLFEG